MAKNNKKSPLKAAPLRNPGQSLDEEITALWDDKAFFYFVFILGYLGIAAVDWFRWLTDTPIKPVGSTIVFLLVFSFSAYKLIGIKRTSERLKMARDGERAVGQYLDILREQGARILHDLIGDDFNVDHLVISEKGIFTVETKTYSKPVRGDARVRVINGEVYANAYKIDRSPLIQSRAQVGWVRELLKESSGKNFPVQGVIVFPGWYVEPCREDVWVLNPKALPAFIEKTSVKLPLEDVHLAYFHLSRYVRTKW